MLYEEHDERGTAYLGWLSGASPDLPEHLFLDQAGPCSQGKGGMVVFRTPYDTAHGWPLQSTLRVTSTSDHLPLFATAVPASSVHVDKLKAKLKPSRVEEQPHLDPPA